MSSFSHLSASHNSNNGNPKKHWRAPAWCDSAIWEAARRFAGITHRRIRRRRAPPGSWCCGRAQSPGPRDRSLETSVLGLRKSPSVHCSKPTAPLAYGWCRRKLHVFSASAVPKSRSGKPVPTCERATDPTFVRLVERKGTVRISAVLNHQVGRQQHRPRAKPHRVARSFQSRPPWACDGISSPSRGLLPPLRFMILSKALKSARACRSVK